jgi:thiaminase
MSFFQELQARTESSREKLFSAPIFSKLNQGDITLELYIDFLTQAYHHVKHTTPLLMSAGSRIPFEKEWLRNAVAEYIEEEVGHQEWILNDISVCGGNKEAVRHGAPNIHTELMVSYAYDMIDRVNPLGFFAMVQVLEGTSIAVATNAADRIQQLLGLPDNAFSYLRSHGSLDLEHIKFFESLMDRIEDNTEKVLLIETAKRFYYLYGNIFRSLTGAPIPCEL